jgi:hypothetical protein
MGGGFTGIGNISGMDADAVVGHAHEMRHPRADELAAVWNGVFPRMRAALVKVAARIIDAAIEVRALVLDLLDHLELTARCRMGRDAGGNRRPADLFLTVIETGALRVGIDHDMADRAPMTVPFI